jgi:cold shock CspA family protein
MGIIRGQGKLIKWQDDKGYGFIRPNDGNQEIFLHISSLKNASRRPKVGDTIIYELVTEKNGKSRAAQASIQGVNPRTVSFQQKSIKSKPIKTIFKNVFGIVALIGLAASAFWGSEWSRSRSRSLIPSIIKPNCNVKGNISQNTGRKLYHIPGMEDYESTVIDPQSGEKWFCTESEAINNGWQKAPN